MSYAIGDRVVALGAIDEIGIDGRPMLFARADDRGTVEYVDGEGVPMVRWDRTGAACDCDPDTEISPVGAVVGAA